MARLLEKYKKEIAPALKQRFGYKNVHQIPRLDRVVINMGVGAAKTDAKLLETAVKDLGIIAGQKAVMTKARRSIANFKLREGQNIGCRVTLRKKRAYEFLDRLISVAIPRIKDFRGLNTNCDGNGNYSMGLAEQIVFPEINADKAQHSQGMTVTFVMKNSSDEETIEYMKLMGFPFKRSEK